MEYSFLHCSRPWLASQDPILKPDRGYPEPLVPRFSHGDRSSRGASDPTRRDHSESIGNTTYTNLLGKRSKSGAKDGGRQIDGSVSHGGTKRSTCTLDKRRASAASHRTGRERNWSWDGENRVRGRRQAATWLGKKLLVPWTKDIARDIEIGGGGSL